MLGDGVIALFAALGIGTWVYGKLLHSTNREQTSVIGAGVVGVVVFIVVYITLKYMLGW